MSAHEVRVDYKELERAAAIFADFADRVHAVYKRLTDQIETLRRDKWIGENADKFYYDMEFILMPAVRHVVESLDESHSVSKEIMDVFNKAEEDAGDMFPLG